MGYKEIRRSMDNKVIAGVCGGLGEYLNIDPIILRLLFVLAFLFALSGGLIYIISWIIIPSEQVINNEYKKNRYE